MRRYRASPRMQVGFLETTPTMRHRHVLHYTLLCWAICGARFASGEPSPLPNIIHILADDYGWADVGYHREAVRGNATDVQTPNLDALVRTGIELDRFYVYKICSPSRSSIQSGRNPNTCERAKYAARVS